jgi:hypothetical protein
MFALYLLVDASGFFFRSRAIIREAMIAKKNIINPNKIFVVEVLKAVSKIKLFIRFIFIFYFFCYYAVADIFKHTLKVMLILA